MAGTIGIKIANGDFYPILTEGNSAVKKRLVLTTVHDGQESVQIDLYRSLSQSMLDAQYIGSLVVESIKPRTKGEASIEMVISCDIDGSISADACNLDAGPGGGHQVLNVSLKQTDSGRRNADFNINNKENILTGGVFDSKSGEDDRKFPWLIMAAATIFVILVIALLWFFFLGGRDNVGPAFAASQKNEQPAYVPPPPPPPEPVAPPLPPPPPPPPVEEPPVIAAPTSPPPARTETVRRQRPPAPVSSYKVPAVIPRNGVVYQIRWGDTLWDISEAFYRNPWLYPRIARHNNIRNPDLIIAGRNIRIPPRN